MKKDIELVKSESNKLYQEIIDNGYNEKIALTISNELAEKGNYSFNKPHSASYAIVSMQTAYLKAHYPVEYYCEVFNTCGKDNGKLNKYLNEAQELGITIKPPHINKSDMNFNVDNGTILFGLNSINKVGDKVVENLIEERNKNGKFTGLEDFIQRVKCTVAQTVMLIKAGCLPTKDKSNMLLRFAEKYIDVNNEYKPYTDVKSLPTLLELRTTWGIDTDIVKDKTERLKLYNQKRKFKHDTTDYEEWKNNQQAKKDKAITEFKDKYMCDKEYWEFEALSIFLSDNPFKDIVKYNKEDFYTCDKGEECVIVGIISKIQKKKDRNKRDYAFVNVYESNGLLEGIAWASVYSKFINLIKKNNKLAFYSEKSSDNTFIIKKIKTIEEWLDDRKIK